MIIIRSGDRLSTTTPKGNTMQGNAQKVEAMSNKQRQKKSNKEHKDFRKMRRNPSKKQWQGI